jgi:hypothetical protein
MMKILAAFLGIAASAVAFAPVDRSLSSASSSALNAIAPEKEVGVLPPVGFFEYVDSPRALIQATKRWNLTRALLFSFVTARSAS